MSVKIEEWKRKFIIKNASEMSDKDLSNATGVCITTVQNIRLSKGLKRNMKNTDPDRRLLIITMLEDYWCNYTNMQVLAKRYGMDTSNISRQIQHLFKLSLNQSTKIIKLKSKV